MKTEKRKAEVGERVLVTKLLETKTKAFRVGDIHTVTKSSYGGSVVLVDGKGTLALYHAEYEVVVEDDEPIIAGMQPKNITADPIVPDHYHAGGIDLFTFARKNFTKEEVSGYHRITAMKYIMRAGKKEGNPEEQDISKAIKHLEELKNNIL